MDSLFSPRTPSIQANSLANWTERSWTRLSKIESLKGFLCTTTRVRVTTPAPHPQIQRQVLMWELKYGIHTKKTDTQNYRHHTNSWAPSLSGQEPRLCGYCRPWCPPAGPCPSHRRMRTTKTRTWRCHRSQWRPRLHLSQQLLCQWVQRDPAKSGPTCTCCSQRGSTQAAHSTHWRESWPTVMWLAARGEIFKMSEIN